MSAPITEAELVEMEEHLKFNEDQGDYNDPDKHRLIAEVRRLRGEAFEIAHRRDQQYHLYRMEIERLRTKVGEVIVKLDNLDYHSGRDIALDLREALDP